MNRHFQLLTFWADTRCEQLNKVLCKHPEELWPVAVPLARELLSSLSLNFFHLSIIIFLRKVFQIQCNKSLYGIVNIDDVFIYSNGSINYILRKKNIFFLQLRLISIRIQCSFSMLSLAFYKLSGFFKHRKVICQVLIGLLKKL